MTEFMIGLVSCTAFLYVVAPLFEKVSADGASPDDGTSRRKVLDEIEDLDLEAKAGKISPEAYGSIRSELIKEAAATMKQSPACECGSAVRGPGDKFCGNCGRKLNS